MATDHTPRPDSCGMLRALSAVRAIGLGAGALCCGSMMFLGVDACRQPMVHIWFGAYLGCFVAMLVAIALVGHIRNMHPKTRLPLRVWPYYLAIVGLLVLLAIAALLILVANMTFL